MLVKVDLGFKFVGGSSLGGPIKQLQNAVSFNFFANTSVYNPMKEMEEYMDKKQKFIYGAFLTPDEADNAYRATEKINQQTSQDQSSNTEQPPSDAEMTTEEKDKINEANETASETNNTEEATSTEGNNPPNITDSDMNRLILTAEYIKSTNLLLYLTIARKDINDIGTLTTDYTVSYIDLLALNNKTNDVKNIPDSTEILKGEFSSNWPIVLTNPLNLNDNELYSVTVKFNNGIDSLNGALKITD